MSDPEKLKNQPTVSRRVEIINRRGLHARASARFVRKAEQFRASITVSKDGIKVCGTSIMGLLMLAAAPGQEVTLSAKGEDAEDAINSLCQLIENKFDED